MENKNSYIDVMLDIETLGIGIAPIVIQISAVAFDAITGKRLKDGEFNELISPASAIKLGLKSEGGTVDWWLTQKPEVINQVLVKSIQEGLDINKVLIDFANYFKKLEDGKKVKFRVWGHGSTFDNSILSNVYIMAGQKLPWHYSADSDVRTLVDLASRLFGFDKKTIKFEGMEHDAIDDCKHQIKLVHEIFKLMVR